MRSIIIPSIIIPLLILALMAWRKRGQLPLFAASRNHSAPAVKWYWGLGACAFVSYVFLFSVISAAWMQGDDWWMLGSTGILDGLYGAFQTYLHWVSRVWEILVRTTGLSIERWQPRILNPLVLSLAPLALFALCKRREDSILSAKGLVFYAFAWAVLLMNTTLPSMWIFFDYANCANYVYSSVVAAWFLSYYRPDALQKESSHAQCAGMLFLGILAGWGAECIAAVICPLLTLWFLFSLFRGQEKRWSSHAYVGYWGFLIGNAMLLLSPALERRVERTMSGMQLDVSAMKAGEVQTFLEHLSWEKLSLISSEGAILIQDFSLFERFWYFSPFAAERLLSCCKIGLVVAGVLSLVMLIVQRKEALRTVGLAILIGGLSVAMLLAYLTSCIPSTMSFFPASFCLTVACCYVFLRLRGPIIRAVSALSMLVFAFVMILPSAIEAWQFKHYEIERWNNIQAQMAAGNQDIVLPRPYPVAPVDRLGMINTSPLQHDPDIFPNSMAAKALGVKSIRQEK